MWFYLTLKAFLYSENFKLKKSWPPALKWSPRRVFIFLSGKCSKNFFSQCSTLTLVYLSGTSEKNTDKIILLGICSTKQAHFISSCEPKAQVRFSDQDLLVVCRRGRRRKLFLFAFSFPEPLGRFQHKSSLSDEDSSLFKKGPRPLLQV